MKHCFTLIVQISFYNAMEEFILTINEKYINLYYLDRFILFLL